jgi:hypothetical protein
LPSGSVTMKAGVRAISTEAIRTRLTSVRCIQDRKVQRLVAFY